MSVDKHTPNNADELRERAEEVMQQRDIDFRKLTSNAPGLIFQFTRRPDGTYCVPLASEGIKDIFGCSPQDVIEDFSPIGRVIYPEDFDMVVDAIEYSAQHFTFFTCEFRVQIPGKPIQWIYSRSTPKKMADGSISWYGFNADITERKLAEEALQQSEESLAEAQRISKIGSWKWIVETNEVQWSDELCRLVGHDPKLPVPIFAEMSSFYTPESWKRLNEAVSRAFNNGESYELELDSVRTDGIIINVIARGEVNYDASGKIVSLHGTIQDIIERKQAEQNLQKEYNLRNMLIDNLPCIAMISRKGSREIIASNKAARAVGAVPGKTCYESCAKRSDMCPFCLAPELWKTNQSQSSEVEYQGTYYLGIWAPYSDDLYVHYVFDITERKRAEEDKRNFYCDTIKSITQGKLNLVSSKDIEDYLDPAKLTTCVASPADTAIARHEIKEFCALKGLDADRLALFETAVGEAMTNAIKHTQEGRIYAGVRDDFIWVAISDNGPGISTLTLPGATLRKGFSTKASMGLGYSIMMEAADEIMLCTGPEGTTVILSVQIAVPKHDRSLNDLIDTWDEILEV